MMRLVQLVLLAFMLTGCASLPPAGEALCCTGPAPGTIKVHAGGLIDTSLGVWQR